MTKTRAPGFSRIYLTLVGAALLGVVVLAGVGYFPTVRLAGRSGVVSMVIGCGASWLASCFGAWPIARSVVHGPDQSGQAILMATAVRFVAILMMVVPLTFSGFVDRKVFVIWVAISYMVLLAVETPLAVRLVRTGGEKDS